MLSSTVYLQPCYLREFNFSHAIFDSLSSNVLPKHYLVYFSAMEEDRVTKRSSLKNWKGREEGKDPGIDGKRKQKRSSSAGSEKMERVGGRQEKNGRTLFERPKHTVGCSANGRRRRRRSFAVIVLFIGKKLSVWLNQQTL